MTNLNLKELLSLLPQDQQDQILQNVAKLINKKLTQAIQQISFTAHSIDITPVIQSAIKEFFREYDVFEYVSTKNIGKQISEIIITNLSSIKSNLSTGGK